VPKKKNAANASDLLTLTDVSERTGISMPTLLRYKKEHQDRIPSVGEGRTQRYPEDALPVFEQIKQENLSKRGRPRKSGAKNPAAAKPTPEPARSDLLTLTEVSERTGISYPTLSRYVKLHGDQIPYEGEGRRRRYHPEAVAVFNRLRVESSRGPRKKSQPAAPSKPGRRPSTPSTDGSALTDPALAHRVAALEQSQQRLSDQLRDLLHQLKQPITATIRP
jgi:DNA-binding transcriptional MerR regulator